MVQLGVGSRRGEDRVDIALNCHQQGYLQSHGQSNETACHRELPLGLQMCSSFSHLLHCLFKGFINVNKCMLVGYVFL